MSFTATIPTNNNNAPVLPIPVWISSAINKTLYLEQIALALRIKSSSGV